MGPSRAAYGITRPVARMLGWLVPHDRPRWMRDQPRHRRGGSRLQIPRGDTVWTLRTALAGDSELPGQTLTDYLDQVLVSTN
jgi:hypothetical protein